MQRAAIERHGVRCVDVIWQQRRRGAGGAQTARGEARWGVEFAFITIKIMIKCGKGFYVRSFVRDLAEQLGTKGHIFSLKRTKVGKFCLKNAILLDDLLKISQTHFEFRDIHPSISMLDDILACEIDDEVLIKEISQGRSVKIDTNHFFPNSLNLNERTTIFLTYKKDVLSFGKYDGCFFIPQKVLI